MTTATTETTEPATRRKRPKGVGGSTVSALFGKHRRISRYQLWHIVSGHIPYPSAPGNRVFWGTYLEPSIAKGVSVLHGWKLRKYRRLVKHPSVHRMVCRPDYEIVSNDRGPGILSIKNVDRMEWWDRWQEGEEVGKPDWKRVPPLSISLQLQHELACEPSKTWGAIVALVGGNDPETYVYERHQPTIDVLEREVRGFIESVEAGAEPDPDFKVDAATIGLLQRWAEKGKLVDHRGDDEWAGMCETYVSARESKAAAQADMDEMKAKILHLAGDAHKVLVDGFNLSLASIDDGEKIPAPVFDVVEMGIRTLQQVPSQVDAMAAARDVLALGESSAVDVVTWAVNMVGAGLKADPEAAATARAWLDKVKDDNVRSGYRNLYLRRRK